MATDNILLTADMLRRDTQDFLKRKSTERNEGLFVEMYRKVLEQMMTTGKESANLITFHKAALHNPDNWKYILQERGFTVADESEDFFIVSW